MQQELKTAGNIKDKATRKDVVNALKAILERIRQITRNNKLPGNGVAFFAGRPNPALKNRLEKRDSERKPPESADQQAAEALDDFYTQNDEGDRKQKTLADGNRAGDGA